MPHHSTIRPRAPRWTADTETAFLLALRLTGSPTAACAAIGRSAQGTYARRRRVPSFAAAWDKTLDELTRTRTTAAIEARGSLTAGAARSDGFTAPKRRAFLQALSETGRYDKAAASVRMSTSGVTKLRQRDPAFAAQCEEALARSWTHMAETLEQAAYRRAVEGVEEPIFRGGQQVGTRRRYSEGLLRTVLKRLDARMGTDMTQEERIRRAHDAARAAGGEFGSAATSEETNASILKSLAAIERGRKRQAGEAAQAAAEQDDTDG